MPQTTVNINTFAAFPGMIADITYIDVASGINADVVTFPAGIMLAYKSGAAATSQCILPIAIATAANGTPAGISVHTHAVNTIGLQTQATDLIFAVGAPVGLLRKGHVYVTPEVTVNEGDKCFYRYVVNGGFTQLGSWSNVTDAAKNQTCPGARFESTSDVSASGFVAKLSYDQNAFLAVSVP